MAWDDENERISAMTAGLGGNLMGMLPWAAAGFQDQDASVHFGTGLDVDDLGGGDGSAATEENRFDWVSPFGLRPRRPSAWRH